MDERTRCWEVTNPLYIEYHDNEWGVPVHDERSLFEYLILEGVQAGLNWELILKKRDSYRRAFHNFDVKTISQYDERDIDRLLSDPGIIRNRSKIHATINNAQRFLEVQKEFGSFDKYIWDFVGGNPIVHKYNSFSDVPSFTDESVSMSKDLKKRGFKFVGPTICYSFMQAVGMVNDHLVSCFRHDELAKSYKCHEKK